MTVFKSAALAAVTIALVLSGATVAAAAPRAAGPPSAAHKTTGGPAVSRAGSLATPAADENDPFVSGCADDAYPVGPAYIAVGSPNKTGVTGFGTLDLYYSPKCNTNWAEFSNYPKGYRFALVAWSHDSSTIDVQPEYWTSNGDELAWTDMVNGSWPAGVGICEDSGTGAVLKTAWMSQSSSDSFYCDPDQYWVIAW